VNTRGGVTPAPVRWWSALPRRSALPLGGDVRLRLRRDVGRRGHPLGRPLLRVDRLGARLGGQLLTVDGRSRPGLAVLVRLALTVALALGRRPSPAGAARGR